ncbi:MAG: DSD1 family PLP-dependent enzyme [Gammaproteobacteria bacterium]|nr:DSD1 family PLP-dependent enzyme [Gammaproteobacteria bacterium]
MSGGVAELLLAQARRPIEPVRLPEPLPLDAVPTPALVVDRAAMERNLQRMAGHLQQAGCGLRPHAKMHKTPLIARRQLELGAVGICCAKVSEAEMMRAAGIEHILITSPVASVDKMARVVALAATSAGVEVVVDDAERVRMFDEVARSAGVRLQVLVDLDPRMGRTGIAPGAPALELVRTIAGCPNLQFKGLQQYAGHLMHLEDATERATRARETAAVGLDTRALIEADGHEVVVFTGGGTGTFDVDSRIEGITDIQAGSYVFMDEEYARIGQGNRSRFDYFEVALFVLVTVISRPRPGTVTVDAGYKSFASDSVAPVAHDLPGLRYHFAGDEHGVLQLLEDAPNIELGDRLRMVTPHCDPTINLHDWMVLLEEDGRVHELWPVAARGCSW